MKNTIFWAIASKDGGFDLGSEFNRNRLKIDLRKNIGSRYKIERITPESDKQRRFFEGAVVPLVTFFQEGMSHEEPEDNRKVRDWLKIEFNGELVIIQGKSVKVAKSTKGQLNKGFLDRVIDWIEESYGVDRAIVLNPEDYKHWHDVIFPNGDGPDNYIDYLVELKKLCKR